MQTKLTLRLDQELIRLAKSEAAKAEKSISQMVADYFKLLRDQRKMKKNSLKRRKLGPITRSLAGALKRAGHQPEKLYRQYLEDKYL